MTAHADAPKETQLLTVPRSRVRAQTKTQASGLTGAITVIIGEMGPEIGWHPSIALSGALAFVIVSLIAHIARVTDEQQ